MSGERVNKDERRRGRGSPFRRLRRRLRAVPGSRKVIALVLTSMVLILIAVMTHDRGWQGKPWPVQGEGIGVDPTLPQSLLPPSAISVVDLTADAQLVLPSAPLTMAVADPAEVLAAPTPAPSPRPSVSPGTRSAAVPPVLRPLPPVRRSPLPPLTPRPAPPEIAPAPGSSPRLAIVIDDIGNDLASFRRAVVLPAPLTLSFLPSGIDLVQTTAAAVAAGHEVFLHMPMEPLGSYDPGPNALLVGLEPDELQRRLSWALGKVPRAVGVNNHMGSRATSDPWTMLPVMEEVRRRGLVFVDSRTIGTSIAADVAANTGVAHASRDVFLDNDPTVSAIRARLAEAERVARRRGSAIAIGHPYPSTLAELAIWLPEAERHGLVLVKASSLARRCAPATAMLASCAGGGPACVPQPVC